MGNKALLLTKQTSFLLLAGYGILESGFVSRKNEVNIMVKNATTVLIGGLIFWVFGFGLSFDYMTNPYFSFGDLFKVADDRVMGVVYSRLVFQVSESVCAHAHAPACTRALDPMTRKALNALLTSFYYEISHI